MPTSSAQGSPVQDEILELVSNSDQPVQPKEMEEALDRSRNSINSALRKLKNRGELAQPEYGLYDLPERVETDESQDEESIAPTLNEDTVQVPLLTMRVEGGTGEPLWDEEVEGYVHYDKNQIRRETGADPNRIAYFPIAGNSMEPTLTPGDRALVARYDGEPLQDGSIYVFRNHRRGTIVKRVYWEDSATLRLQSDNDEGPTIKIDYESDGEDWNVLGRVLRVEKHL